jgi:hypothetical protein
MKIIVQIYEKLFVFLEYLNTKSHFENSKGLWLIQ